MITIPKKIVILVKNVDERQHIADIIFNVNSDFKSCIVDAGSEDYGFVNTIDLIIADRELMQQNLSNLMGKIAGQQQRPSVLIIASNYNEKDLGQISACQNATIRIE
ncbi:MAG: hypothetical protein JW841_02370 [Deltaproteobacteria bacterium]|nr:hypothetical protein [Deltaproteobacteria bacterium]